MSTDLDSLFSGDDKGSLRMFAMLRDPNVSQICINRHDRIIYWDNGGQRMVNDMIFPARPSTWLG